MYKASESGVMRHAKIRAIVARKSQIYLYLLFGLIIHFLFSYSSTAVLCDFLIESLPFSLSYDESDDVSWCIGSSYSFSETISLYYDWNAVGYFCIFESTLSSIS